MMEPGEIDKSSTNSGSSPNPASLLEDLLVKISSRNIPIVAQNPEMPENSRIQYEYLTQSHNAQNRMASNSLTERRAWPEFSDRLDKPRPEFRELGNEIQTPFCNGMVLPPLRHSDYNPLRIVPKVDTSNRFLPSNGRITTPIVKSRPAGGFQLQQQQRQPILPIGNQVYGRQQQWPNWLESNRRQNPMTNNGGFRDNFHLPPIDLKQNQNIYFKNQGRPMTAYCPRVSSSRPFSAFEGKPMTPGEYEVTRQLNLEIMKQERANQIHPYDDNAARVGKMRRTCQKFDQSNSHPYARLDGFNGANEIIGRQDSYQNHYNSQGYFPDIGPSKQVNVACLRPAAKKHSKTRVCGRSHNKNDYLVAIKDRPSGPRLQISIEEFEPAESSKPKPRRMPSWMERSVENGAGVIPSICWESDNTQVRSKHLQRNYNSEEDNFNTG